MNEKKKTSDLSITTGQIPCNTDPTFDTQSAPNPLKRQVSVGRSPEKKDIPFDSRGS